MTTVTLTEDLRDVVRQIAVEKIAPRAGDIDRAAEYPQDIRRLLAENDVFALPFEEGMQTGTSAARELLYAACRRADEQPRPDELGQWTSMAKLFASDNAMKVTVEAVQVLGGYGDTNDYPVERMMRDAKITQI